MKKIPFSGIIMSLCFSIPNGITQSAIDASGGYGTSANFNFSYAIGEVSSMTLMSSNKNSYATSGVIQPDPYLIIKTDEYGREALYLFPNPTNQIVYIQNNSPWNLNYIIRDMQSHELARGIWSGQAIQVGFLASGAYFIELKTVSQEAAVVLKFIKL